MGTNAKLTIKQRLENFKAMEKEDKRRWWGEFFIDNSLYIFLIAAIIGIAVYNPNFVSMKSIINIVSLSAANLPIALGIAGAIILHQHMTPREYLGCALMFLAVVLAQIPLPAKAARADK